MAVLTDIVIASANDAPAIIAQWPGSKMWPGLQTTGLDGLVLADLAEALGQVNLARSIEDLDPSAFADEANGPWVYVLPNELRDHLANIDASDLDRVAQVWAEKEEASARGLTAQDAQRLLLEIQPLAAVARDGQKPMLLWISM
ncbi:hypothetical protein EHI47_38925 [Rhizobium leguminosarum]|uniref:Uncharacterized protein n=1 Tax=Rhizobium leguminosarum TaxID=384 RepID=A0A444HHA1_RHILE|nr:hypothetical protein [Rhizobium leguminosarum]RWX20697.1 hypothetical protein EHI47_38925 [Rhizobium leguminosarum]